MLGLGSNVFDLYDDDPFITLHQSTQSMNVSFISDLIDDRLPFFVEVGISHSFTINFYQSGYSIDVECMSNCEIEDQESLNGSLFLYFFSTEQGELKLKFNIHYFQTSFSFELIREVVLTPAISITSPLFFTIIDDVIVQISVLSKCSLYSEFQFNNSVVFADQVQYSFIEYATFPFSYSYLFNVSYFNFSIGESDSQWSWKHIGFENQIIGDIKIFNTEFTSSDHVSVYEHRDIGVDFVGLLYSQFKCVVGGNSFLGTIINDSLICTDLFVLTFQEVVSIDVYFEDLFINSFAVRGEAFLEEICFVPISHHPKIENSRIISNISTGMVFDGSRCCSVDVSFCSEFLKSGDVISVNFTSSFDIFTIVITTNTSCQDVDFTLAFDLIVNKQSVSHSVSCKQIPSGFDFALMCELQNIFPKVSEIILISRNDVFLLELDFYGYQSYTCLTPVDINKGITSLGEELEETIQLKLRNVTFVDFEQFKYFVSQSSHLITASHLSYSIHLISPNCFHSQAPFTITFTPGKAFQLIFVQDYLEIDPSSLNLTIPILCVDSIGFVVECLGNLSVHCSTFNWTHFELFSDSVVFSSTNTFKLGYHHIELEFQSNQLVQSNFTIAQTFAQFLIVDNIEVLACTSQNFFDRSCTLLRPFVLLITRGLFLNSSQFLHVSDLVFGSTDGQAILTVTSDFLEIITYPLHSMTLTVSYFSQSITLEIIANDCHFPKLNSDHVCLCPKGMEFNFHGECVECHVNYYSNSEFNSECRSCPYPRITLQKGSSDLDHCVCPLNTLDSVDSCLPCPHLAECGYGNLTGIEPGFRLNTDTWELDECVFWFSCHENSCRSRHAYGDLCQYCSEDVVSSRIYCIGKEHLLFKLVILVLCVFINYLTDLSMNKFLELEESHEDYRVFAISKFRQFLLLRSKSRFSHVLFVVLFSFSIFKSKSTSFVVVFLNISFHYLNLI
ncbi:hypothetical protein GEMRC1_008403 [Eukaryota sp. GEM-RC1]